MAKSNAAGAAKASVNKKASGGTEKRAIKTLASTDQIAVATSVGRHIYTVVYVPPMCGTYAVNDQIEIYVNEPPPLTVTIRNQGECRGTVLNLDE